MDISGNLKTHNFIISIVDTDSCTIGNPDNIPFSQEEIDKLHKELNSLYGEHIKWDFEASYKKIIAIRTKNYVLQEPNGKVTIRGSALKASTKSVKMKQFIKDVINGILDDKNNHVELYLQCIKEMQSITDMKDWSARKTITKAVLTSERKNETSVKDAIVGSNYVEGDRCNMFFKEDGTQCLVENFNGDYSKDKLLGSIWDTIHVFSTVLDLSSIVNYKLKKNKKALAEL